MRRLRNRNAALRERACTFVRRVCRRVPVSCRLRSALCGALALLAGVAMGACEDAATAPNALLVGGETKAALQVAQRLPTVSGLSTRAMIAHAAQGRYPSELLQARSLWLDAEQAAGADAERLREAAYELAVPQLATALTEPDLLAVQDSMRQWIRIASTANGVGDVTGIAGALDEARRLLDEGALAEPADHPRAIALTLRASDRLLSTTPRAVATRLVGEVEARWVVYAAGPASGADGVRRERADRLVRGAREALRSDDYLLAIRRAYYAGQLLGGG